MISISDVITNSSSEVFVYCNKESENKLKDLVNTILETFNVGKTFDDLFSIEYNLSEWAGGISIEDALEEGEDDNGYPLIESYRIVAKDPEQYGQLCHKLSNLDNVFYYGEVYC